MSIVKTIPVKTWQFFHACKTHLGTETLTKLFQVSLRQVDRWSCDPDFTESTRKNPVDRYETLLKKLMERGVLDIARAMVDRQARIVGCVLKTGQAEPDKDTLEHELLDNMPAYAEYQEAARTGQPIQVIRGLAYRAIDEIEQDLALLEQEEANRNERR